MWNIGEYRLALFYNHLVDYRMKSKPDQNVYYCHYGQGYMMLEGQI